MWSILAPVHLFGLYRPLHLGSSPGDKQANIQNSATGTRTRVARVRAEYPNQLDYSGFWWKLNHESRSAQVSKPLNMADKHHGATCKLLDFIGQRQ